LIGAAIEVHRFSVPDFIRPVHVAQVLKATRLRLGRLISFNGTMLSAWHQAREP
jgi:hypothetical protein